MDFALTEEQEMLKKMARDFLTEKCPKSFVRQVEAGETGHSPELWREMAGLGWPGLAFPEEYGGTGMSFFDLSLLLEEMGRACLPGPFFSTVILAGLPILEAGSDAQKRQYLPAIGRGESIFTLALTEAEGTYDAGSIQTKATAGRDGYTIDGVKLFVPDAHVASHMLCVARTGKGATPEEGISIFIVDARSPGIACTPLKAIAGRPCEVVFSGVKVPVENVLGQPGNGRGIIRRTVDRAAIASCCDMIGGAQQVLEMTVAYSKERKQFDRPIGSFQALQHYMADMALDVEGSRFITHQAAWMLSEGLPCTKEIATAKAWVGEAYRRVLIQAHQVHGAIGFSMDHDLQLYYRRAKVAEVSFGDADFQREVVARQMGL
ncbi:MAG: acyl-CoA dehydrogenase family protein [Chloroflexota bacterium]